MLDPMAAICCWACNCAPWPTLTMAITAPTPMMMPSMVSMERSLLRARARMAMRMIASKSIVPLSAPGYATFGSNNPSGVFGPILPSFTRRATIEPMVRLCVLAIW